MVDLLMLSQADVLVAYTQGSTFPNAAAYMARCAARPAYARAFGRETADALTRRCEEWATR